MATPEVLAAELARVRALVDGGSLVAGAGLLGVEMELHLVDPDGRPAPRNAEVLTGLAAQEGTGADVQRELARFNVEANLPPVALDAAPLSGVRRMLDAVRAAVAAADPPTTAVAVGILPTLSLEDLHRRNISDRPRYHALDARIMALRGGRIPVAIDGTGAGGERLDVTLDTILLEAAATSLQIHLDLPADGLVAAWNTAQAVAGLQVALAANSPLVLGRRLWHESRIPVFEQIIDLRDDAERAAGVPPRVWFGADWIAHAADPFAENLARFPPLLDDTDADPDAGDARPDALTGLRLHNGTVWRWNRPVYALLPTGPTLRIENRVLSAPPTATDAAADVALFLGLVAGLRDRADELTARLPFAAAEAGFRAAAHRGLGATLPWPAGFAVDRTAAGGAAAHDGTAPHAPADLLHGGLLDVAAAGLAALGVSDAEARPALATIADRAAAGRNGATWQLAALATEERHHDRPEALRRVVRRYRDLQDDGDPVHTWPEP
jgi:hypothetical protein